MRPWILSETNYGFVKDCRYQVAVLPTGATEPHNLHLPYGTDTFQADAIATRACEAAWNRGARVVMLPPIPYGTETNQSHFPLSMNLHPSTLMTIFRDLLGSLTNSGINKLLILNSHGGNEFKPMLRELMNQTPCKLFLCDWFRGISADLQQEIFEDAGDHAGEMETALGLAFFREFVATDENGKLTADDGAVNPTRFDAVNQGWVSISRPWHLLTSNTGSGNPHAATAEKGRQLMEGVVGRLSEFLVELAGSEVDESFPF
ncbi:creatininase family protein [Roseiconus lacunae]|uniref:Creatininase family protein n=1 Tax=Roseiconus lacunae TaxID=2605694 RepID=A0ABT7PLL2_9BACT|nr:creatininase family protein [Roseiconus lacunae]MDM4017400.1 creatininase family protein [Roseiconus lacunae]